MLAASPSTGAAAMVQPLNTVSASLAGAQKGPKSYEDPHKPASLGCDRVAIVRVVDHTVPHQVGDARPQQYVVGELRVQVIPGQPVSSSGFNGSHHEQRRA